MPLICMESDMTYWHAMFSMFSNFKFLFPISAIVRIIYVTDLFFTFTFHFIFSSNVKLSRFISRFGFVKARSHGAARLAVSRR